MNLLKRGLFPFPPYFLMADDGAAEIGGGVNESPAPEPANTTEGGTDESNPFGFANVPPKAEGNVEASENSQDTNQQQEPVVPEEYEFKLAEGLEVSDELRKEFTAIAKECKLTQAQADKLLDLHSNLMLGMLREAEMQHKTWMDETTKLGLNSEAGTKQAKLALDTFGGSDAINILMQTGAIYHPAVFKMFKEVGSLLQEDTAPQGKPTNPQKDLGSIFFPNSI